MNQKKLRLSNKLTTHQLLIFSFGLVIFITIAFLGWQKLKYGFNLTDEGFHMTASWRLAAGDHFLKNRMTGAHNLTTVINSLVFKTNSDITLLGFRQLQFGVTIFSLLIFSFALLQADKQFWFLPYVLSLFAFTGLDPMGNFSNLTYYTYPHLFITLSLSFLIFGLHSDRKTLKSLMLIISGFMLWGISFSLLNLSLIFFYPILLYTCGRILNFKSYSFTLKDLCYILIPFILCWIVFVMIYNNLYISAVYDSVFHSISKKSRSAGEAIQINWAAINHIGVSFAFLIIFFIGTKKLRGIFLIMHITILSIFMYIIIKTSFFGTINPYFWGIYPEPMWFTSLLVAFFIIFCSTVVKKYFRHQSYTSSEELCILLLLPVIILSISRSMFATTGILSVVNFSIPVVSAMAFFLINNPQYNLKSNNIKLLALIFLFAPFYITTARADWGFTYFDVAPEDARATIQSGFGKGIKTNNAYNGLYNWVQETSDKYTTKNDYMISYATTSMVHMIAKRRPSLDKSFFKINNISAGYLDRAINNMIKLDRQPAIAYVFESPLSVFRSTSKGNRYSLIPKQFQFLFSKDVVTAYIKKNMIFVDRFKISNNIDVKCFVDKNNKNLAIGQKKYLKNKKAHSP